MTIHFTIAAEDALAFTTEFLKHSPSHQKARRGIQFFIPGMLLLITFIVSSKNGGLDPSSLIIWLGVSLAWYFLYPKQFDKTVVRQAKKQLNEAGHQKSFGKYTLELQKDVLLSSSSLGKAEYKWSAISRIEKTNDYLFIFLNGPIGFPIKTAEVGRDNVQKLHTHLLEKVSL